MTMSVSMSSGYSYWMRGNSTKTAMAAHATTVDMRRATAARIRRLPECSTPYSLCSPYGEFGVRTTGSMVERTGDGGLVAVVRVSECTKSTNEMFCCCWAIATVQGPLITRPAKAQHVGRSIKREEGRRKGSHVMSPSYKETR